MSPSTVALLIGAAALAAVDAHPLAWVALGLVWIASLTD
mgnify:CR=1 FL=1